MLLQWNLIRVSSILLPLMQAGKYRHMHAEECDAEVPCQLFQGYRCYVITPMHLWSRIKRRPTRSTPKAAQNFAINS